MSLLGMCPESSLLPVAPGRGTSSQGKGRSARSHAFTQMSLSKGSAPLTQSHDHPKSGSGSGQEPPLRPGLHQTLSSRVSAHPWLRTQLLLGSPGGRGSRDNAGSLASSSLVAVQQRTTGFCKDLWVCFVRYAPLGAEELLRRVGDNGDWSGFGPVQFPAG